MLEWIVSFAIATFIGIAVFGHVLVFQAMFGRLGSARDKTGKMPESRALGSRA